MRFWAIKPDADQAEGPFDLQGLKGLGWFSQDTLVAPESAESEDAWKPAKEFADLKGLFIKPPPLPKKKAHQAGPAPTKKRLAPSSDIHLCPRCDYHLKSDAEVCDNCGADLPASREQPAPLPRTAPASPVREELSATSDVQDLVVKSSPPPEELTNDVPENLMAHEEVWQGPPRRTWWVELLRYLGAIIGSIVLMFLGLFIIVMIGSSRPTVVDKKSSHQSNPLPVSKPLPEITYTKEYMKDHFELYDFKWADDDTLRCKVKFKGERMMVESINYEAHDTKGTVIDTGTLGSWTAGKNTGKVWEEKIYLYGDKARRTKKIVIGGRRYSSMLEKIISPQQPDVTSF